MHLMSNQRFKTYIIHTNLASFNSDGLHSIIENDNELLEMHYIHDLEQTWANFLFYQEQ